MTVAKTTTLEAARSAGAVLLLGLWAACGSPPSGEGTEGPAAGRSWSVTAWGDGYEVFPEIDALTAGEPAVAHVHVTRLDGFEPLERGEVTIVLGGEGGEREFSSDSPARPGLYTIEVRPERAGEYDLAFRVAGEAGSETIRGGRVRVGSAEAPGGVVRAPAPRGATGGGEPISFLKEQQWRTPFGTEWVRVSSFARSLGGLGVIRPVAGGESWITAPVAGTVRPEPWPYPGRAYPAGAILFRLVPSLAAGESLADLQAERSAARDELAAARARLGRLEALIEVEATSEREVEEARTRVEVLQARTRAAERNLASAEATREGRGDASALALRAPFSGQISRVEASPGANVSGGERLARLVRVDAVWIEVDLPPDAGAVLAGGVSGLVIPAGDGPELRFGSDEVSLVSIAPEVDPETGKLAALLALPRRTGLALGSTRSVRLLLSDSSEGTVVPASALVDDAGVPVVFLQLSGESFVRQEVRVVERQGDRILVEGLVPGQRLVTAGGDALRRETLLSSGAAHGHVH